MKNFFFKDSVLKMVSFVVAIIIWLYIIVVADPSVDIPVKDIPIRYVNQTALEERGLALISDPDATVELKIRGSRKKIANIDNKNVYATVDLANIGKTGTFSLPINISIPYEYDEIVSKKPYNADVIIDRVLEQERDIQVIATGEVANGYIAGKAQISSKSVVLSGPSTILGDIRGVAAYLSYDGRSAEIKDVETLYFIDGNGKKIEKNSDVYDMVRMDISSVEITCPVMKLKSVPIVIDTTSFANASSYKISVQPSNVSIYAENEILENISEIVVEKIDFKKLVEEGSLMVKLDVPEGVSMRDGIGEVTIKASPK